jgi:hypothetical protein
MIIKIKILMSIQNLEENQQDFEITICELMIVYYKYKYRRSSAF